MWDGRDDAGPRPPLPGQQRRTLGVSNRASGQSSPQQPPMPPAGRSGRTPPPPGRTAPSAGGYATANPFRPYGTDSGARLPAPRGAPGYDPRNGTYGPTLGGVSGMPPGNSGTAWHTSALPAEHRRHIGIAIFHDGNPGHIWRGSVASHLGETLLGVGVLMWLALLTASPLAVALAVALLGLPLVLAGPFSARLENSERPEIALRWIGRLRIVLTLGLLGMHFRTLLPVVYALLFGIALCGRLHDALRTAAIRTCLAPGEPEHVANDMYVGGAFVGVLGPLLATFCYILNGERILLVSIVAVMIFLISANSDNFLDALPPTRRAFLLATPQSVTSPEQLAQDEPTDDDADADDDDSTEPISPEERRELRLPEWYQQGPTNAGEAIAELRVGLGLAGTSNRSTSALLGLCALALCGGGLAALEVSYLTTLLLLPIFYLGPLIAAEGAGVALGVVFATGLRQRPGMWRILFLGGLAGWGAALLGLARIAFLPVLSLARIPLLPSVLPPVLLLLVLLGVAQALAGVGAREALSANFRPAERRALAAAQTWVVALAGVVGSLAFAALFIGTHLVSRGPKLSLRMPTWPIDQLLFLMGGGLIVAAILLGLRLSIALPRVGRRPGRAAKGAAKSRAGAGRLTGDDDADDDDQFDEWDDADDDEYSVSEPGYTPPSRRAPRGASARRRLDDTASRVMSAYAGDDDEDDDAWQDEDDVDDAPRRAPGRRDRHTRR